METKLLPDSNDVIALNDAIVEARNTLIINGFPDLPFLDDGIQNAINKLRSYKALCDELAGWVREYSEMLSGQHQNDALQILAQYEKLTKEKDHVPHSTK